MLLPDEDDQALEKICPEHLKGRRKTALRVRWAILELCHLLPPNTAVVNGGANPDARQSA
jgi:hypothetical protein